MQRDHFLSGVVGLSLIVGVIIAWAVILLPSHAATLAGGNAAKSHVALTISNSARKGDRLVSTHAKIERSAPNSAHARKGVVKIPVGCDPAFSRLVKLNVFPARCVTSIDGAVKVALAR